MPLPDTGRSFNGQATLDDGPQRQETLKVDHRWSDRWTTAGMYGYQHTKEPGSAFWGEHFTVAGDPGGSLLYRTINFFSVNNILIPDNLTTVAIRYGYNRFKDAGSELPAVRRRARSATRRRTSSEMPYNTFPNITLAGYSGIGNNGPNTTTHVGQTANVTLSRLMGNHSVKAGVDYRRIVADAMVYGSSAGAFTFNQAFTQGPTPTTASSAAGDSIASFLLGYPASGEINVGTPASYFINYYSAYMQDDYRVSPSLTLNMGLRYEYEPGVGEKDNRFTVGFDREAPFPIQVPGLDLQGRADVCRRGRLSHDAGTHAERRSRLAADSPGRSRIAPSFAVATGCSGRPDRFPASANRQSARADTPRSTTYLASTDGNLTPAGIVFGSISERRHAAAGQLARPADRRRRRHRLRRSETRSPATCSSTRSTSSVSCRAG